jgi:hypothetical protein
MGWIQTDSSEAVFGETTVGATLDITSFQKLTIKKLTIKN